MSTKHLNFPQSGWRPGTGGLKSRASPFKEKEGGQLHLGVVHTEFCLREKRTQFFKGPPTLFEVILTWITFLFYCEMKVERLLQKAKTVRLGIFFSDHSSASTSQETKLRNNETAASRGDSI